jgi:hypothetical protein
MVRDQCPEFTLVLSGFPDGQWFVMSTLLIRCIPACADMCTCAGTGEREEWWAERGGGKEEEGRGEGELGEGGRRCMWRGE